MWNKISAWFKDQGGFAHVVAGFYLAGIACYTAVPAFHQLVIDIWAKTPSILREIGLAILGLASWYTSTHKSE